MLPTTKWNCPVLSASAHCALYSVFAFIEIYHRTGLASVYARVSDNDISVLRMRQVYGSASYISCERDAARVCC